MYRDNWYDKLYRKFGRYSIRNLMNIIVAGMGIVFLMDIFIYPITHFKLSSILSFNRYAIMHGQLWRLITFIFIPPNSSPFFILFSLYFYWLIGGSLENQWGSFRFNLFYVIGILGTAIAGIISGYATNYYLNMSLFLAFALIYPDFQVNLFFFLPVKIKYLALIDAANMLIMFLTDSFSGKIALIAAITNVLIFFWNDFVDMIKTYKRRRDFRKNSGNYWK